MNWKANTTGKNGHNANSTNLDFALEPEHAATTRSTSVVKSVEGPILRMQVGLRELGRERAIASGALKPDKADLQVLQEHAESMARETWRDPYDPANKPHDRMREQEYAKNLSDRGQIEDGLKYSAAEIREKEDALAKLPTTHQPQPLLWLMWALGIGIAATIAPTLHDYLFASIEDSLFGWLFAALSGGFVAGAIVWGILGSIAATHRTVFNWIGLVAGLIVSAALGLLRWSTATDSEETVMAVALTVFEIGLVVMADWIASGLRRQYVEWQERQMVRDQAQATVDAARSEHQRRQARLDELNGNIRDHIEYVEDLHLRNVNLNELIAVAVKAVTDGFFQGVAINLGKIVRAGGVR